MKKIITFFSILFLLSSCKKEVVLSSNKNKLITKISKNKLLIDKTNYKLYYQLKDSFTTDELVYLTNHKNANVRCLVFTALVEKNYPKIQEVFFEHIGDSIEKVQIDGSECLKPMIRVNNYMLLELHPISSKSKYKFNGKEFDELFKKYFRIN